jgi:hypothetical protein
VPSSVVIDRCLPVLVLAAFASACAPREPAPNQPTPDATTPAPQHACTQIGCVDGLRVMMHKAASWQSGAYELAFDIDGTKVSCKGALPLPACDEGPGLKCDVPERVQITESGCALPADQHGFGDIGFTGEPARVKISVRHAGKEIHAEELAPSYKVLQPNGEGCEPTCNSATAELKIP